MLLAYNLSGLATPPLRGVYGNIYRGTARNYMARSRRYPGETRGEPLPKHLVLLLLTAHILPWQRNCTFYV